MDNRKIEKDDPCKDGEDCIRRLVSNENDAYSKFRDGIKNSDFPELQVICNLCNDPLSENFFEKLNYLAKVIYNSRCGRVNFFKDSDLFGEPAWDIILDLFIREIEGKSTSITSACIGSGVATTTALRWIKILEVRDLIVRKVDPDDGRRSFITLTSHGMVSISNYLIDIYKELSKLNFINFRE